MHRPFFRKQTKSWYVWVGKKLVNLGKNKKQSLTKYQRFCSVSSSDATYEPVVSLLNRFLDWTKKNRSPRTYRWYKDYLKSLAGDIGKRLCVADLTADHVDDWVNAEYAKVP